MDSPLTDTLSDIEPKVLTNRRNSTTSSI